MKISCIQFLYRRIPLLVFGIGCMVLISCKSKLVGEGNLIEYTKDPQHGLIQTKETGVVKTEISYRPTDQIVWQELKGMKKEMITDSLIENKRKEYGNYYYFILSISVGDKDLLHGGSNTEEQFAENLNRLSFHMPEYTWMKAGKDTIPLADYQFPRMYGMTKSTQVLLAFEKPEKETPEIKITLEDIGIGIGKQTFIFETKAIQSVPELDFGKKI